MLTLLNTACNELTHQNNKKSSKRRTSPIVENPEIDTSLLEITRSARYENLSQKFIFTTKVTKFRRHKILDSTCLDLEITSKNEEKIMLKLNFCTNWLFEDSVFIGSNVRSYITGINVDEDAVDGNFGDIVVSDINFDQLEDVAILLEQGNAGSFYAFYVQQSDQTFIRDVYLSDSVRIFPSKISREMKTITTLARSGVRWVREKKYRMSTKTGKWTLLSNKELG